MSIKKNYVYTVSLSLSQLLLPLVTFPYITRVLGPERLGIVNFATTLTAYIVVFSALGINIYGQREVARLKNNLQELSRAFNQIFMLHVISSFTFACIFFILIFQVPKFTLERDVYLISVFGILINSLSLDWVFQGREQFKFLTLRSIVSRLIIVCLIFIFVTSEEDYKIYFLLTTIAPSILFFVNLHFVQKTIRINIPKYWNLRELWERLKALRYNFLYMTITTIYGSLSVIYLGFVATNSDVGIYSVAYKFYTIILSFFSALTIVLYPRTSTLLAEKNEDECRRLMKTSFEIFIPVSLAIATISILLSDEIVFFLAGASYLRGGGAFAILMPLIFFVGLSQIYIAQSLFPRKKDKFILKSSTVVLGLNIVLTAVLVKLWSIEGAAIALLISEIVMTVLLAILVYKLENVALPIKLLFQNLTWSIPYLFIFWTVKQFSNVSLHILITTTTFSAIYFVILHCLFLKNPSIISLITFILPKHLMKRIRNTAV